MPASIISPVGASADAVDLSVPNDVPQVWTDADRLRHERILAAIRREERWQRDHDRDCERMRAQRAARSTEITLLDELADRGEDWPWNPKRALDLQDFAYLFLHRNRFSEQICQWLEIVNAKITHVHNDGEDGYFKKLEQNIGWARYITPIIFSGPSITDRLVRCGLWSHAKNSRRCHQTDFCPFCLWNDILKTQVYAFGERSGTFFQATAWFFITIGWTTNPANAKCCCDDYDPDQFRPRTGDVGYDPYPIILGWADDDPDLPFYGYDDARTLGSIMQWGIGELYHRSHIDGYHSRLEGDFRLNPGGANRVNLHEHTVANGGDDNGQFIAEQLREFSYDGWKRFGRDHLNRTYYPDIHVQRITSPEHLEHATIYQEKVTPIGHGVSEAMGWPEARGADGFYDARYIAKLKVSLARLVDDDIPAIFTGARLDEELPRLFRRRTQGNMRFTDKGTCIGDEPDGHIKKRHRAAKLTREARARKKKREEEMRQRGMQMPRKKQYPRRRKGHRRLPRV
jgi:hypothetical protein